jgi:hypothetical protein
MYPNEDLRRSKQRSSALAHVRQLCVHLIYALWRGVSSFLTKSPPFRISVLRSACDLWDGWRGDGGSTGVPSSEKISEVSIQVPPKRADRGCMPGGGAGGGHALSQPRATGSGARRWGGRVFCLFLGPPGGALRSPGGGGGGGGGGG